MSRMALAPNCAREYETIYILKPDIDKEAAEAVAARVAKTVSGERGILTGVELWGRRRLAYNIAGFVRGIYVYVKYNGANDVVKELERQLRLADGVIRYQTIVLKNNVELAAVQVAADDVAFEFDLPEDSNADEISRERELGLLDTGGYQGRARRDYGDRRDGPGRPDGATADDDGAGDELAGGADGTAHAAAGPKAADEAAEGVDAKDPQPTSEEN